MSNGLQQGSITYTLKDAYNDPQFLALPFEEKIKAAQVIDQDFSGLDPITQNAVMEKFEAPRQPENISLSGQAAKAAQSVAEIPANLVKGGLQGTIGGVANVDRSLQALATLPTLGDPNFISQYFGEQAGNLENAVQGLQGIPETRIDPKYNQVNLMDPLSLPATATNLIGQTAFPMLAASGATLLGGPAAGIATTGTFEGGQKYGELVTQGVNPQKALLPSIGQGAVAGGLEYLPLGRLFKTFEKTDLDKQAIKEIAASLAKQAGLEGATEAGQELSGNIASNLAGVNTPLSENVLQSGLAGALTGGVMEGGGRVAQKITKAPPINNMQNPMYAESEVRGEIVKLNDSLDRAIRIREDRNNWTNQDMVAQALQNITKKASEQQPGKQLPSMQTSEQQPQTETITGMVEIKTSKGNTPVSIAQAKRIASVMTEKGEVVQENGKYFLNTTSQKENTRNESRKKMFDAAKSKNITTEKRKQIIKERYNKESSTELSDDQLNDLAAYFESEDVKPEKKLNSESTTQKYTEDGKVIVDYADINPSGARKFAHKQGLNPHKLDYDTETMQWVIDDTLQSAISNQELSKKITGKQTKAKSNKKQSKDLENQQSEVLKTNEPKVEEKQEDNKQKEENDNETTVNTEYDYAYVDIDPLKRNPYSGTMTITPSYDNQNNELLTTHGKPFKLSDKDADNLKQNEDTKLFKDIKKAIIEDQEIGIDAYDADQPTLEEKYKKFIPMGFQVTGNYTMRIKNKNNKEQLVNIPRKDVVDVDFQEGIIWTESINKKGDVVEKEFVGEIISRPGDISVFGYRAEFDKGVIEAINKEHPDLTGNDIYKMRSYRIDRFDPEIKEVDVNNKGKASKTGKTILDYKNKVVDYDKYSNFVKTEKFDFIKNQIKKETGLTEEELQGGKISDKKMQAIQKWIRDNDVDWRFICEF